jgi:hypothetical protein
VACQRNGATPLGHPVGQSASSSRRHAPTLLSAFGVLVEAGPPLDRHSTGGPQTRRP